MSEYGWAYACKTPVQHIQTSEPDMRSRSICLNASHPLLFSFPLCFSLLITTLGFFFDHCFHLMPNICIWGKVTVWQIHHHYHDFNHWKPHMNKEKTFRLWKINLKKWLQSYHPWPLDLTLWGNETLHCIWPRSWGPVFVHLSCLVLTLYFFCFILFY